MASWKTIGLPVLNSPVNGVTDAVSSFSQLVETFIQVLEIVQSLLNALKDPRAAIINQIVNAVKQFLENLKESGVFYLPLIPKNIHQLSRNYRGGHRKYEQLIISSLQDTNDPERPQIGPQGTMGGLCFFYESEFPMELLEILMKLAAFLNRQLSMEIPPPVNVRIQPADKNGIPMEQSFPEVLEEEKTKELFSGEGDQVSMADIFSKGRKQPETLLLQWEEDAVSGDVIIDLFKDSKFYIEKLQGRTKRDQAQENPNEGRQGPLESRKDNIRNPQVQRDSSTGQPPQQWVPIDENNPFVPAGTLPSGPNARKNFLTGSYAYIIRDQKKGEAYGTYYRVRAVPEGVELSKKNGRYLLTLNGEIFDQSKASSPVYGVLPKVDAGGNFDPASAIWNTYRAAYYLRFDKSILGHNGNSLIGSGIVSPDLPEVFFERDFVDEETDFLSPIRTVNPSGTQPVRYFEDPMFPAPKEIKDHFKTKRALLNPLTKSPQSFSTFGGSNEFLAPAKNLSPGEQFHLAVDSLVQNKVEKLTKVLVENESLYNTFKNQYLSSKTEIELLLQSGLSESEFLDDGRGSLRSEVARLIRLLESNVQPGQPPNWESIQLIDDFFPPIGELIDRLISLVESLQNIIETSISQLSESIENLQDQLRTINQLIEMIERLLEILEQLELVLGQASVLWIDPQQGGKQHFVNSLLSSGNKPDPSAESYFAGMVFAFGGPGVPEVSQQPPSDDLKQSIKALKEIFSV